MITSTHYQRCLPLETLSLPIRLHERPDYRRALGILGVVLAVFLVVLLGPIVVTRFVSVHIPFSVQSISSVDSLLVGAGIVCLLGLLTTQVLVSWLAQLAGRPRVITINAQNVRVREKRLFRTVEWVEPLSSFNGVERSWQGVFGRSVQVVRLSHSDLNRCVTIWIGHDEPEGLIAGYETLIAKST